MMSFVTNLIGPHELYNKAHKAYNSSNEETIKPNQHRNENNR